MSKLLTVIGATGTQGGSVIDVALKEGTWKIRGITRNVKSEASKALAAQGVEMISADVEDEQSLIKAFKDSTAIFGVTNFFETFATSGPEAAIEAEVRQGTNIARAATTTPTLEHYIWSTLPNGLELSGGKYLIPHFESKNRVDAYIKADPKLYAKTTFLWVTYYASNYLYPIFTPNLLKSSGKYVQLSPAAASTPLYTIGDTRANVGVFATAILRAPAVSQKKFVLAATASLTAAEMLATWSRATGHAAEYVQVSVDEFDRVWPVWGREMALMMAFWDEVKERSWTGGNVVGAVELGVDVKELVGLEEAFKALDWKQVL